MPIIKWNKENQHAIYKGGTAFEAVFMGDALVWHKLLVPEYYGISASNVIASLRPSYTADGFASIQSIEGLPNDTYLYCAISDDGSVQTFSSGTQRYFYHSVDYGSTWLYKYVAANYGHWPTGNFVSGNGQYFGYSIYQQGLWMSSDGGYSFDLISELRGSDTKISYTGQYMTFIDAGTIYTSSDYGATFIPTITGLNSPTITMNSLGDIRYYLEYSIPIVYKSIDYGQTWDAGSAIPDYDVYLGEISTDRLGKNVVTGAGRSSNVPSAWSGNYGVTWSDTKYVPANPGRAAWAPLGESAIVGTEFTTTLGDTFVPISDIDLGRESAFSGTLSKDLPDLSGIVKDSYITEWEMDTSVFQLYIDGKVANYVIDWGDNSETVITEQTPIIEHTYATAGTYQIKMTGNVSALFGQSMTTANKLKLTKVIQWGDLGLTTMTRFFMSCANLNEIPAGPILYCENASDISWMFYGCTALAAAWGGVIPTGLLDNMTSLLTARAAFYQLGITTIPDGLFDYTVNFTEFYQTFSNNSITTIPNGLFDHLTKLDDAYSVFSNNPITALPSGLFDYCTKLISVGSAFNNTDITEVPSNLFDFAPDLDAATYTFYGCNALVTVPAALFYYNTKITNLHSIFKLTDMNPPATMLDTLVNLTVLESAFHSCAGTSIPANLLQYNTELTTTDYAFAINTVATSLQDFYKYNTKLFNIDYSLSGYQGTTIPSDFLLYNTALHTIRGAFANWTVITTVPSGIFDNLSDTATYTSYNYANMFSGCTALTTLPTGLFPTMSTYLYRTFQNTFYQCINLTTIPADLFEYNSHVTIDPFLSTFYGCGITAIPAGLFDEFTSLTNFDSVFQFASSLVTIPAGLLDFCVAANDFNYMFRATAITSIPSGLFDNVASDATFPNTFYDCASLATVPSSLFRLNTGASFYGTFKGCHNAQIPADLFYNAGEEATRFAGLGAINVGYLLGQMNTFTGTQGTAPDFWNCTFDSVVNQNQCFLTSSEAFTNWAVIPIAWGGPA